MPRRIIVCTDCGEQKPVRARDLCNACYQRFYDKHLRKSPRTQGPGRLCICESCGAEVTHYGKGLCKTCYLKDYHQRPEVRQRLTDAERERRADNRERYREVDRKRNRTARRQEWRRQYQKEYCARNREKLLEYQREYRRADTARQTIYKQRRRNRVACLPATLTPSDWNDLLQQHAHACFYCHRSDCPLEAEHKLPASRKGGYTKDNIVPSCGPCNRRKKQMTVAEYYDYLVSLDETPLFDRDT